MSRWQDTLKPRASSRVQVLLAGALWTVVGGGLFFFGSRWIGPAGYSFPQVLLLLCGIALGVLKSRYVLDRAGAKIVERIGRRGEGRCLGGFLSPQSWALVLAMVAMGRLLRGVLPPAAAGVLYAAIGTALFLSSRLAWQQWRSTPAPGGTRNSLSGGGAP